MSSDKKMAQTTGDDGFYSNFDYMTLYMCDVFRVQMIRYYIEIVFNIHQIRSV